MLWILSGKICRPAQAEPRKQPKAPELSSVFPIGGAQGTTLQVEIRGKNLEGSYAIWFDKPGLKTAIKQIQQVDLEELKNAQTSEIPRGNQVIAQIEIDPSAAIGCQFLRLVSSAGVSNALPFTVSPEVATAEVDGPHDSPTTAQQVRVPLLLQGRLRKMGEVDFYSFEAAKDEELRFECFSLENERQRFEPRLTLFDLEGSWFDPSRPNRLAAQGDETAKLVYRFRKRGRYLLEVRSFLGLIGPSSAYQLIIASSKVTRTPLVSDCSPDSSPERRAEKAFLRKLEGNRLTMIASRSVSKQPTEIEINDNPSKGAQVPETDIQGTKSQLMPLNFRDAPFLIRETEPNNSSSEATEIRIPTIIEGTIGSPGDVDAFKLRVQNGAELAFELETPDSHPPYFNPHLAVVDTDGRELFTNVFKKVGGDGDDWQKLIQAKTIYTFEAGEVYTLQVRDITARLGESSFKYRILVRPQIPHVGTIQVKEDRLNLFLGEAGKMTVTTEQEEGFEGQIALTVENLPFGVQALPGTEVEADRPPPLPELNKERFVPKSQVATILLMVSSDAPPTSLPQFLRLSARAVVQGRIGAPIFVREVPLMILKSGADSEESAASPPNKKDSRKETVTKIQE
jgi:hypothetical protein